MSLSQIVEMRGAGAGVFGSHRLCFGRAAARAGMAHRWSPIRFEADRRGDVCSCYVLNFRTRRQEKFLKIIIANCSEKPNNLDMTVDWIRKALVETGKTRSGLAKALGRSPSAVTDLLNGSRRLRAEEIAIAVEYLGVEPPRLVGGGRAPPRDGRVPLVGYVGAGAVAHFYADGQGPFDEVPAPDAASGHTVAVQIRGHSLGALFDNWLVFYDDVRDPPGDDLVGRMCVCGLADGRILIKALKRSQNTGLWNLLSNLEPPIYDVVLEWAAVVREMRPR